MHSEPHSFQLEDPSILTCPVRLFTSWQKLKPTGIFRENNSKTVLQGQCYMYKQGLMVFESMDLFLYDT